MTENVTIDRRFRGPEGSANGGYAAGLLAAFVDGPAEVTLRLPPPLERPLAVERDGGRLLLLDGEAARGRGGSRRRRARAARARLAGTRPPRRAAGACAFEADTFRGCFSCGQLRDDGDGLRIFPGRSKAGDPVAAPWVAREASVPRSSGRRSTAPAPTRVSAQGRGETVLGRMAARIERLPDEGERCVVIGWPRGEDGRKLYAGTALWTAEGELPRARPADLDRAARDLVS